jgi:hypothetical protein
MAASAICLGERGTCGDLPAVSPEPVTAQVMKTSRFMDSGMDFISSICEAIEVQAAFLCFT